MNLNSFVNHLAKELDVECILCYGSHAQEIHDNQSDIDLLVLTPHSIPSENLRKKCYSQFPDTHITTIGKNMGDWDVSWSPINDCLVIEEQKIDIGYNTLDWVKRVIDNLINTNKISFDEFPFRPYTFLGLLETSIILYDKNNFIRNNLSKIRPIPIRLKQEIINHFLPVLKESYDELNDYSQRNIGILAYQFQLFRAIDALISLLFIINDYYDPASKRIEYYLFKLQKKPDNFVYFIENILPRFYENKIQVVQFLKASINFIERSIN